MKTKLFTSAITLLFFLKLSAQEEFPLKFFNGELDYILEFSSNFSNEEDFFWRAKVLNELGKTQEAISLLEKGIDLYDTNKQLNQLLADYYYKTHQYSNALALYKTDLESSENFIKTITILDFQNKHKISIDLLKERVSLDSSNVQLHQMLGDQYLKLDSLDQGMSFYQRVLSLNPNNQRYAFRLASLYNKAGNYNNAIAICDSAISKDSTSFNFIKLKGFACFKMGEYELAYECFKSLLISGDSSISILKNAGISKSRLNEVSESKDFLREAYFRDSTDYEVTYFLSKCYENSTNIDSVLYLLKKTEVLLTPDSALMSIIYIDKARYYHSISEYQTAVKCYIKAHSYKSINSLLFNIASINQYKLNNFEQALKYYEAFIENVVEIEKSTLIELAYERVAFLKKELFFEGK